MGTRRRWLLALSAGALVASAGFAVALQDDDPLGVVRPRPAPVVSAAGVRTPAQAVQVPGDGPAVVNFFASWCTPCREELPELQRVFAEHGPEVAVVGVDVADNRRKAVALLDAAGAAFPAAYDPDKAIAARYAVNGMPTTVFVDAEGRIVGRVQGKVSRRTLLRWVDRLRPAEEAA